MTDEEGDHEWELPKGLPKGVESLLREEGETLEELHFWERIAFYTLPPACVAGIAFMSWLVFSGEYLGLIPLALFAYTLVLLYQLYQKRRVVIFKKKPNVDR